MNHPGPPAPDPAGAIDPMPEAPGPLLLPTRSLGLVALLQLATFLDPEDPLLERRHRLCSRLAVAAVLGFLLMVPLHINAGLRQSRTITSAQAARLQGIGSHDGKAARRGHGAQAPSTFIR